MAMRTYRVTSLLRAVKGEARRKVCLPTGSVCELHRQRPIKIPQVQLIHTDGTRLQNVEKPSASVNDPYLLVQPDLEGLYEDIRTALSETLPELKFISTYYFDGKGKAIRPVITMCMARAINAHLNNSCTETLSKQKRVAQIAEMIHTASLVHDDVIDEADSRRGKASVNILCGQKKSIMAGDFIIAVASGMLARLRNEAVMVLLSQVLADLVQGEFMQLGAREDESERFTHYLEKTFKKTASLIAYSCQSVSVLSGADTRLQNAAFSYGRQVGIAFQLVDDLLDFVASSSQLGKPAAADLNLGLATAPVLFAAQEYPELNSLIMRRFSEPGDVERTFEKVVQSEGLERTKQLAQQYCNDAIGQLKTLNPSPYQQALISITHHVLHSMVKDKPNSTRLYDKDGYRLRAACVCVRGDPDREVLLVTSSNEPDRWIVPGGGLEPMEEAADAAVREVLEEAGVTGQLGTCLGVFENNERKHRTVVYVMNVTEELPEWDDSKSRRRQWFSFEEALSILSTHKPLQSPYLLRLREHEQQQQQQLLNR